MDPVWQGEYASAVGGDVLAKRYRDWGTLRYLFRGIQKHLPFVNQVFLLVSGESQVPEWIDRENVHVVLHKDIIPERFLPTFNSTTIEMFMHRIPGLGEEFLYFNDDMFPVMDCRQEDFFVEGKPVIGFAHHLFAGGKYKKRVRNSDHQEETISKVVSRLRTTSNFNQYLFLDYLYYQGKTVRGKISNKHLSPAVHSPETIARYVKTPSTKLVCINDVHLSDEDYVLYRDSVLDAFGSHFPEVSRFEKQSRRGKESL